MHYIAVGGFEILKVLVGKVGENKNGFNRLEQKIGKAPRRCVISLWGI
ncbi:hypothetical protein BTH160X_70064 [Brochothrix thermosphacta]|nr:hypothetical protein BTH160X_70064 [Brochothrix thermosphacta]